MSDTLRDKWYDEGGHFNHQLIEPFIDENFFGVSRACSALNKGIRISSMVLDLCLSDRFESNKESIKTLPFCQPMMKDRSGILSPLARKGSRIPISGKNYGANSKSSLKSASILIFCLRLFHIFSLNKLPNKTE